MVMIKTRLSNLIIGIQFEKPNTVSSATICAETGKKARTGCKNTYTEYYLWLTVPGLCDEHTGSEVDKKDNDNSNKNLTNTVQDIIEGITNDIDAIDPQESQRQNMTNTNSNTTTNTANTTNTTNTSTNTNTSNSNISTNTNHNTNTSSNTSITSNTTDNTDTTNSNVSTNSSHNTSGDTMQNANTSYNLTREN